MHTPEDDFVEFVLPVTVQSPCVSVCRIDPANRLCIGCKRTIEEIARWGVTNDADRQAILDSLRTRTN